MAVVSHRRGSKRRGYGSALRRLYDPLLLDPRSAHLYRTAAATSLVGLSALGAVYLAHRLVSEVGSFADFYVNVWWAGHQILDGRAAVPDGLTAWPPTATVFVAPLALLPYWVALAVFTAISVGAFVAGLHIAGCRDRRALLVAALSPPAVGCVALGNLSLLLAAGVAVAWAYRDRAYVSGIAAGAVVAAKIWLWPILIFFVLTRRWLSFVAAVAWGVAGATIWFVLSPATLRAFPDWSQQMVEGSVATGIGLSTVLVNAGTSVTVASALALGAALVVLAATARARDEATILAGCVAAALVGSPLVWHHYYAVLFVPIVVVAPRLGALWFAPYLAGFVFLWPTTTNRFIACSLAALAGTALVTSAVAMRTRSPRRDSASATGQSRGAAA